MDNQQPVALTVTATADALRSVTKAMRVVKVEDYQIADEGAEPVQVARNREDFPPSYVSYSFDDTTVDNLYNVMQTVPGLRSMFHADDDMTEFGADLDEMLNSFATSPQAFAGKINVVDPDFVSKFERYNYFRWLDMTAETMYQVKLFELFMYRLFFLIEWPKAAAAKLN